MSLDRPQATGGDWRRASDRDREATVAVLRDAYVAGRLNLGELRDRAGAAYAATTWEGLHGLIADLLPRPAQARWQEHLEEEYPGVPAGPEHKRRRPFAPMRIMALVWLAIAAAAPIPAATVPLVLLALFAFWAACWAPR